MPGTDLFYPKPAAPRAPRAARQGFRARGSAFRDQRSEVRGREEQNHHQSDPSGPSYLLLARSAQPAARSGFLGFLGFLPGSTVLVRRFSPEPHRRLSAVLTSDLFFSTVWKTFFHRVEKSPQSCSIVWKSGLKVVPLRGKNSPVFPRCGKLFSTVWNFFRRFFHGVELFLPVFPQCGKPTKTRAAHRVRLSYHIAEGCLRRSGNQKGRARPCPLCAAHGCGGFLADFGGAATPKSTRNPPDQTPEDGCRFKVAGYRKTAKQPGRRRRRVRARGGSRRWR